MRGDQKYVGDRVPRQINEELDNIYSILRAFIQEGVVPSSSSEGKPFDLNCWETDGTHYIAICRRKDTWIRLKMPPPSGSNVVWEDTW